MTKISFYDWAANQKKELFDQPKFLQEIDSVAQIAQPEVEVLVDVAHTSQVIMLGEYLQLGGNGGRCAGDVKKKTSPGTDSVS